MNAFPNYEIEGRDIVLAASGQRIALPFPIKAAIPANGILVVLLDIPPRTIENENVFGMQADGTIAWQIERLPHVYEDSPYTSIATANGEVTAFNWDGDQVTLETATGKAKSISYKK